MPEKDAEEQDLIKTEETTVGYSRAAAPTYFVEGFTLRTVIGAFFVGFIMMPASIYLGLVAGQSIGSAAQWVTIILFMEIIRRSFGAVKRQELYLLYYMAGALTSGLGDFATAGGPFTTLLVNQYILSSPPARAFGVVEAFKNEGVNWIAPFPGSEAITGRTFLHPDWIPVIAVVIISGFLSRLTWFGMGYTVFRMTSDIERLPFPLAPIAAQGATALAEVSGQRETWRWHLFSIGAAIGILFGGIYLLIPAVTSVFMSPPLHLLPMPFIELNGVTEAFLPAAIVGINTNLGEVLLGFLLPFPIVMGTFISSVFCHIVLNPILHLNGLLPTWRHGMGIFQTQVSNYLDFWLSVTMGSSFAVAGLGIATMIKILRGRKENAVKLNFLPPVKGRGDIPIWLALAIWAAATAGLVILCHKLVPTFPLWIFIFFGFLWSPLNSYVSARMRGLSGGNTSFPFFREGFFVLSGYKGSALWWAPFPDLDYGFAAQTFREVELTGTKFTSIIKMEILMFPLILLCSFIFWSFIWRMGPIPSSLYPHAAKFWPIHATMRCMWSSVTGARAEWLMSAIKWKVIFPSAAVTLLLYPVLHVWLGLPQLFYYGLVGGVVALPNSAIPLFIGAMIRKFFLEKKYGRKTWSAYAPVLMAGFACGLGLMGMAGVAIALISKAVYQAPF